MSTRKSLWDYPGAAAVGAAVSLAANASRASWDSQYQPPANEVEFVFQLIGASIGGAFIFMFIARASDRSAGR